MSNRSIQWVIGLGVLAILAIIAGQAYFFYKAFDLRERQTVQSFRISLQAVAESISQFNKSTLPDNIIHQYSPDYFIVDINNRIDPWILEHYLRSELARRHLNVDFEYAIYDCDDDRMVYGNYVSHDQKEEVKNKLEYWPKYEQGFYYFGVHFPGLRNYILGEMKNSHNPFATATRDVGRCPLWVISGQTVEGQNLPLSAVTLPAQPIDATQALNLSAGVSNCKVSRGRSLS